MVDQHNPKLDAEPQSNTEKDPEDWVTGDEPMTGAQQAHEPDAFADNLSKADASKRIDVLKEKLKL